MRNRDANGDFGLDRARTRIKDWQRNFGNLFLRTVDGRFYINAKTEACCAHAIRTVEGPISYSSARLLRDACIANVGETKFRGHETNWVLRKRKFDGGGVMHCV
jgi:hypothetical protein